MAAVPAGPAAAAERQTITAACTAAAPAKGEVFSGPVLQVLDGRTFCVADGPTPDHWIRMRLADVRPGNSRRTLMAAAFAKDVICTVDGADGEGAVGRCVFNGEGLGELVRTRGVRDQAVAWR